MRYLWASIEIAPIDAHGTPPRGVNGDGTLAPPYKAPRYIPLTCVLCYRCFWDAAIGRCIFGGPFSGLADAHGRPLPPTPKEPRNAKETSQLAPADS